MTGAGDTYLADLTFSEIALILEFAECVSTMQHARDIERIRSVLRADDSGSLR
jgi:hypothetical protein